MPNIHGALVHVPTPKPRFGEKVSAHLRSSPTAQGVKNKANAAFGNVTSRAAQRAGARGKPKGMKFGRATAAQKEIRTEQRFESAHRGTKGFLYGGLGTAMVAGAGNVNRNQKIERNKASIRRNQKKLAVEKGIRPRAHLITDLGTGGGRTAEKADYGVRTWKAGLAGLGVGATTGTAASLHVRHKQKGELKRQSATLKTQRGQLRAMRNQVSKSAFGVVH